MEGRREEVVTNDSFRAVTGKDDEVDYVFQKDARRGDTRRRSQQGGGGEYNSATWKPVFHRQPLSTRETASRTTNDEQEGWVTAVSPVSFSPSLAAIDRRGERRRERENRKEEEGVSPREIAYATTGKWRERLKNLSPSTLPICDETKIDRNTRFDLPG